MPRACPSYRLRIFLSVDLVGSTAFKVRGREPGKTVDRLWVKQINHFYSDFPDNYRKHYTLRSPAAHDGAYKDRYPRLWKTLGDELVLCGPVMCHEHLAIVMSAFARAVKDYGLYLEGQDIKLDVKGTAWIAPFPEPNVTIRSVGAGADSTQSAGSDQIPDEAFEADADAVPRRYDFLGRHIDTGFRISAHARTDFMPMSVELAFLLAEVSRRDIEHFRFVYEGRRVLKGVLGDRPYPVVGLDTERSGKRRAIKARERSLAFAGEVKVDDICEFLQMFMDDEGMEPPILRSDGQDVPLSDLPASYADFAATWVREEAANTNAVGPDDTGMEDGEAADEVPNELAMVAHAIAHGHPQLEAQHDEDPADG